MINNKAGNNILQELVARHPGLIHTDTRVSYNSILLNEIDTELYYIYLY